MVCIGERGEGGGGEGRRGGGKSSWNATLTQFIH